MPSTTEQSADQTQFGLADLFSWMIYCAAYFAILSNYTALVEHFQELSRPEPQLVTVTFACWGLLLWHYWRLGHRGAIAIHVGPALFVFLVLLVIRDYQAIRSMTSILFAVYAGTLLSFPASCLQTLQSWARKTAGVNAYAIYNFLCGWLGVWLLFAMPSLAMWRLHGPSIVFGLLLGLWCGVHQAIAKSPELHRLRLWGIPARPAVTAGLITAIVGPIAMWSVTRYFTSFSLMLGELGPLMGVPAAILVGLLARRADPAPTTAPAE